VSIDKDPSLIVAPVAVRGIRCLLSSLAGTSRRSQSSRGARVCYQPAVTMAGTLSYNLTDLKIKPNYSYVFNFEEEFDTDARRDWMKDNWNISFYYAAVYMVLIYLGRIYMKTRERFDLRIPLFIWNLFLSLFSIWGALRTLPEIAHVLSTYGFMHSLCIPAPSFLDNRVGGFWNWMFTLSKVPELGDTVFIVLRKQPLIFLHWYHHVTVLLYTWYSYSDYIATARWFVCMNYLVHSVMYSYYALKALRVNVPKFIAMIITSLQLAQMVMGTAVNIWAYQVKTDGNECHVSMDNIKISLAMYSSYFILFAQFFYRVYFQKPKELEMKKKQDKKHD